MSPVLFRNKMLSMRVMLIILVLYTSVPSLLLFAGLKKQSENQVIDILATTSTELAQGLATAERIVHTTTGGFLRRAAEIVLADSPDLKASRQLFENQLKITNMYRDILLVNSVGDVLVSGTAGAPANVFDMFLSERSFDIDKLSVLPGSATPPYTEMVIPCVLRIAPQKTESPRHFLIALIDTNFYASIVRTLRIPDRWTFSLVDSGGVFLFRYPDEVPGGEKGKGEKVYDNVWQLIQAGEDQGWIRARSAADVKRIFGFVKLYSEFDKHPYITAITAYPEAAALQESSAAATRSIVLMICFIGLSSLFALYLGTRYLAIPLEKYLDATRRFATGDLSVRSGVDHRLGEIGLLAHSFDEMAEILEEKDNQQRETEAELALYTSKLEVVVRQRTEALEESQKRTRLILDSTSEGILELDLEHRITFANRAALLIFDKTEQELLSYNFFEALPHINRNGEACLGKTCPLYRALIEQAQAHLSGFGFSHKDGSFVPVDLYTAPVVRDGRHTGSVVAFVDLTASLETHEMMDAIYRTTTNGYISITDKMEILDCNPAMVRMLGASSKSDIVNNFAEFSPTFQTDGVPSAERYHSSIEEALRTGCVSLRWTHMDAERNLIPCAVTLTLVHVNQRRLVIGSVQDLRDQLRAQEALDQQREQLRNILDSTPIILVVFVDEKIYTVNRNGTRLLGLHPGDSISSMYADIAEHENALETLKRGEPIDNRPMKLKDGEGNVYSTLVSFRPFIYEGKRALMTWITDVTELTRARQEALDAARVKSDFLASMSHEIRTPMNAILGMSHLCLQTEMTTKQRNYLKKIHGAATALLSIINDILDFSKIEAGKLTLEKTPFHLSETLKSLWDLVAFRAEEKGILFTLDIDSDVPECLKGDSLRLNQILLNLCNNAIKFTESGKIIVHASSGAPFEEWEGGKAIRLYFDISDTGIGMTPEQLQHLFSPFSQADTSITRRYGGSGLGLTICQSLIRAMDGDIRIESVFNEGTTVHFSVKLDLEETAGVSSVIVDLRGLRALVVDDSETAREILQEQLVSLGLRADTVSSGWKALTSLRNAIQDKDPYAFVIIDWRMPAMDGEETVHRIREDLEKERWPRVLMISAYNDEECRTICKKLSISGFIPKPVSRSDLYDALISVLTRERRENEMQRLPLPEPRVEARIEGDVLLVEDNLINQEVAVDLLEGYGARVDIANNGAEALEAVKNKKYDLVLMDIQMPVMDGLEATRHIRALPECEADLLPIVAMTAHAMQSDYEKSLTAGMNDHITKPINPHKLYQTLCRWLRSVQGSGVADASRATTPETERILSMAVPGLSTEEGLLYVNGNATLYRSLLRRFSTQHEGVSENIQKLLETGDSAEAKRLVHSIKSVSGTLGMALLSQSAMELESVLDRGENATEYLEKFTVRLHDMTKALRRFFDARSEGVLPPAVSPPPEFDAKDLTRTVEVLPDLLREDLMKAWSEISRLEPLLADSPCAAIFSALAEAVRNFDELKVEEEGQALLRCLKVPPRG